MKYNRKIILNDAIKTFTNDQDKILSPRQTIDKVKAKLQSLDYKILNDTFRIDNGRLKIPVFFSLCGTEARKIIGTNKQMGKGATADQAEASSIMELVERYSFFSFYKNSDNVTIDTYANLKNEALSFDSIVSSVHDEHNDLEISKEIFQETPLKWTSAYNLTTERKILVPLNWFYAINAFNGPSAGNCAEEAICQGICEVVERHVSALISKNSLSTPEINLESINDFLVLDMLKKYFNAGIKLVVTDFSLGIGIPSIGVLAYDPKTFPKKSEIVWTAGTATSPQKALSRALSEVAQLAGDFNTTSNYVASGLPKFTSLNEFEFLVDKNQTISIDDLPNISHRNIKSEVENCVSMLSKLQMDTIVVDTTHPILEIPSFYTIVPGAHFRERANKASVGLFLAKIISESFIPNKALIRLIEMDRRLPEKYFIQFYIGKCYLEMGKYNSAILAFSKALEFHPDEQDRPSVYSYLSLSLKALNRYEEAIQVINKGIELDKKRTDLYNLKGFCYFMLKKYEKSIENFKKVIALDPSSAIDYANIASNYRDMGKKHEAIRYYKIALKIDSSIKFASKNLDILTSK